MELTRTNTDVVCTIDEVSVQIPLTADSEEPSVEINNNRTKKLLRLLIYIISFMSCVAIAAIVDIYIFSTKENGLSVETIDLFLGYGRYEAAIALEGDLQMHSHLSSYELLGARMSVKYSDAGKETFDEMTDAVVTVESTGGFYDTGVKILIGMTKTNYNRVETFMWDALNGGTPFTYVETILTYTVRANVLFGIPIVLGDVSSRKVIPLNKGKVKRYRKEQERLIRSLASVPFGESYADEVMPSFSFGGILPFDLKFDGVSNERIGMIASVNKKNPFKFLRSVPSVEIHIPAVQYSFSMVGNSQGADRYRVKTEAFNVELAGENLDFELSAEVECSNQDDSSENCQLVKMDYLNWFYDRLCLGNVDFVVDADEENYITRMLGATYSLGTTMSSIGSRRALSDAINGTTSECFEVRTLSMVVEACINESESNSLVITGTLERRNDGKSLMNVTLAQEWDNKTVTAIWNAAFTGDRAVEALFAANTTNTTDHKDVDLIIDVFYMGDVTVHAEARGQMTANHLEAFGSVEENIGSTSFTEAAVTATYASTPYPLDISLEAVYIHMANSTTNGTVVFWIQNQSMATQIDNHDDTGSERFYGSFEAGLDASLTKSGSGYGHSINSNSVIITLISYYI
jgi:hypothetical protein